MSWPIGEKPPLHRKFDEAVSIEKIRTRYQELKRRIPSQIAALQADSDFRQLCVDYYEKGYKDWLIISAVYNCMLNWLWNSRGYKPTAPNARQQFAALAEQIDDTTFPAWRFDKEMMDNMIATHNVTALQSYGFQPRRPDFHPDVVERFLRDRMRHFELDLPHVPLFGTPPGDWPIGMDSGE